MIRGVLRGCLDWIECSCDVVSGDGFNLGPKRDFGRFEDDRATSMDVDLGSCNEDPVIMVVSPVF